MRNFDRTFKFMLVGTLAAQACVVAALVAFVWWLFAHGFHDLGAFLLRLTGHA